MRRGNLAFRLWCQRKLYASRRGKTETERRLPEYYPASAMTICSFRSLLKKDIGA
jgi:hypothetical protein